MFRREFGGVEFFSLGSVGRLCVSRSGVRCFLFVVFCLGGRRFVWGRGLGRVLIWRWRFESRRV